MTMKERKETINKRARGQVLSPDPFSRCFKKPRRHIVIITAFGLIYPK